jgi:hypothetical protein
VGVGVGVIRMGIHKVEVVCRCWKRLVVERVDWVDFYWLVSFDLVVGVGGPLCRESVLFCQVGVFVRTSQGWKPALGGGGGILYLTVLVAFSRLFYIYIVILTVCACEF